MTQPPKAPPPAERARIQTSQGARCCESFRKHRGGSGQPTYSLMPLRFMRLDDGRCLVTNMGGEYCVLSRHELDALVDGTLSPTTEVFANMAARHMVATSDRRSCMELLATKYRTKQSRLPEMTGLHMFVVTLRCTNNCKYCQTSHVSSADIGYDMSEETALLAVKAMFMSPSRFLKVEFQGGEPLLNFPLIKFIVEQSRRLNDGRDLEFVVASNLALLNDEMLDFFAQHKVYLSTSLDGPAALHNANRPSSLGDSHGLTVKGIAAARMRLGNDAVSALLTVSRQSLQHADLVVEEYARLGFQDIFLRWLSPFGDAAKCRDEIGYSTEEFIDFYKRALARILELNLAGYPMREVYASLILHRILSPLATGYVDLQSPSGAALSGIIYHYNGDVCASDEGRMLLQMGDNRFRMGNLHKDSYESLFVDSDIVSVLSKSMSECIPGCEDCALQPICGSDPVTNYRTQGDIVGHRPTSAYCRRNRAIICHLIEILEADGPEATILRGWGLS